GPAGDRDLAWRRARDDHAGRYRLAGAARRCSGAGGGAGASARSGSGSAAGDEPARDRACARAFHLEPDGGAHADGLSRADAASRRGDRCRLSRAPRLPRRCPSDKPLPMAPDSPDQIAVTLPDGSVRRFARGVTGGEIAASIGPGLAKAAVAVKLDGEAKDLTRPIEHDAKLAIMTRDAPEAIEIIRHDAAHVMAEAVKELYPETQVTFGPATDTGFYYDFARATPFTPEDLATIELRMHEIVDRDEKIAREEWERDGA